MSDNICPAPSVSGIPSTNKGDCEISAPLPALVSGHAAQPAGEKDSPDGKSDENVSFCGKRPEETRQFVL